MYIEYILIYIPHCVVWQGVTHAAMFQLAHLPTFWFVGIVLAFIMKGSEFDSYKDI